MALVHITQVLIFLEMKVHIFWPQCLGTITYLGFSGSGGYTIILENENKKVIYCHVSPLFLVNVGDYVEQSQIIRSNWSTSYL